MTKYDLKRLELYSQNMVDYHLVTDMLPMLSKLYFMRRIDTQLSIVQSVSIQCSSTVMFSSIVYLWELRKLTINTNRSCLPK